MTATSPRTARRSAARQFLAGGTSVVRPSRLPWIAAAAAGGLLVILALVLGLSGDDTPGFEAGPAIDEEEVTEGEASAVDEQAGPTEPPAVNEPAADEPSPADAAQRLAAALRTQRLWSTVTIDPENPNVLIIQSSLCGDDALSAVVTDASGELRSSGVTVVRCMAPHGGVIFEKNP